MRLTLCRFVVCVLVQLVAVPRRVRSGQPFPELPFAIVTQQEEL